jgi:hypothetical protein
MYPWIRLTLIFLSCFILFPLPIPAASLQMLEQPARIITPGRAAPVQSRTSTNNNTPESTSLPANRNVQQRVKADRRRLEALKKLPDLIITQVTSRASRGSHQILKATVKNIGKADADRVTIRFINARTKKSLGEKTLSVRSGKTEVASLTIPMSGTGRIEVQALIDPAHRLKELNRKNNISKKIAVTLPEPFKGNRLQHGDKQHIRQRNSTRIDNTSSTAAVRKQNRAKQRLTPPPVVRAQSRLKSTKRQSHPVSLKRLHLYRTTVQAGQSVIVRATLKNQGSGEMRQIPLTLFIDGKKIQTKSVNLAPRAVVTTLFRQKIHQQGRHKITVRVGSNSAKTGFHDSNMEKNVMITCILPAKKTNRPMAAATRTALAGTRAATPISIPRTFDQKKRTPKTTPEPKSSRTSRAGHDPGGLVRFDPGIGPERQVKHSAPAMLANGKTSPARAVPIRAAIQNKREGTVKGQPVTFAAPTFQVTAPKAGATLLYTKTYPVTITWTPANASPALQTITLMDALHPGQTVATLYPGINSPLIQLNHTIGTSFTVPKNIKEGQYFLNCTFKDKNKLWVAQSGIFTISWKIIANMDFLKAEDPFRDALPGMMAYALDRPIITYFDYGKIVPKGSMLDISFYWQDGKKNLAAGKWTIETKKDGDTTWQKHSGKLANLPAPESFHGSRGLCSAKIRFRDSMGINFGNEPVPTTLFRFFLTDATGLTSNVVTGTINKVAQSQRLTPQSRIGFLYPPDRAGHPGVWRGMNPLKPGETINIQFELACPANTKSVPVNIELIDLFSRPTGVKITTTVQNKGGGQRTILHTVPWQVPTKLEGMFVFKASSPTVGPPAISATFPITEHPKKQKWIEMIRPLAHSKAQIGNQVTVQWLARGFDPSTTVDIFFRPDNREPIQLNSKRITLTDRAWNWNIAPGTVPAGEGALYIGRRVSGAMIVSEFRQIFITDPHHYAPFFTVSSPGPGQTAHWLAGTSVNIEWQAHNFEDHVTFLLEKIAGKDDPVVQVTREVGMARIEQTSNATKTGKTVLTLPSTLEPGVYRLIVTSRKYGIRKGWSQELEGTRRLVEIINPDTDSLPAPGTKFEITKAAYPDAKGNITVAVGVSNRDSFRFSNKGGPGGTQSLSYRLSNYELFYPDHRKTLASGTISVLNNSSVFPNRMFPPGSSVYILNFHPKLFGKKLQSVTVRRNKNIIYGSQTGNFPDQYSTCQYFLPKLELFVTTYLSNGKAAVSNKYVTYIKNAPGMSNRTEKLEKDNPLWDTFSCATKW